MPVTPTYPGIYIQEAPSTSHTIVAAQTNIAAFIGYTHPLKTTAANIGKAVQIFSFQDYQRQFGGFVRSVAFANQANDQQNPDHNAGDMAVAVNQFFLNGGATAYIVALSSPIWPTSPATLTLGGFVFAAQEVTDELYAMTVNIRQVVPGTVSPPSYGTADIVITYGPNTGSGGAVVETYRQVTLDPTKPGYILNALAASALVTVSLASPPPSDFSTVSGTFPNWLAGATDFFGASDFTAVLQADTSLDKVPLVNLVVIPGVTNTLVVSTVTAFCERKYAFLILDPVITDSADGTLPGYPNLVANTPLLDDTSKNAALYFPFLLSPDPITGSSTNPVALAWATAAGITAPVPNEIPPAGTVAGIFAATDVSRGVWKAPAGFQANASNVTGVVERGDMTDARQGTLNPLSINCLRSFANVGTVVFGSRTLAAQTDQQWTYVPVRRMALFLEQTFLANLKWVVFEPNAQPLWSAITLSISAFMLGLFKQGAFAGDTPSDSFSVQCGSQTTTQADIDSGIVNIVVAFAPLKPAEFVVITIAQLAGQTQSS
jgi:uncharacterized protein